MLILYVVSFIYLHLTCVQKQSEEIDIQILFNLVDWIYL